MISVLNDQKDQSTINGINVIYDDGDLRKALELLFYFACEFTENQVKKSKSHTPLAVKMIKDKVRDKSWRTSMLDLDEKNLGGNLETRMFDTPNRGSLQVTQKIGQ